MKRIQFALFAGMFLVSSRVGFAQETEAARQEAQKLYEDGAKDMDQGAYRRACPKLEAARKILPGHVRTAMTLAECYDKLGEPATAIRVFEDTRPLASAQGKQDKVVEIDAKLAALAPRTPRLTISVPRSVAAIPGLSVTRNGVPISGAQWGVGLPVNPGRYEIEVTALDKPAWKTVKELQIGQALTVEITPPWSASSETPVKDTQQSTTAETGLPEPAKPKSSGLRTAGFVGIGLGGAALGVGAILGGLAVSKNNESDDGHCKPNNVCDQIGFDLRTEARAIGNASTAMLVVGGVLAGTGIILVAISPSPSKDAQASLWIGPNSVGVRGAW